MPSVASEEIILRPFEPSDWPQVWQIVQPVFRAGETYAFSPDISEADAKTAWITVPSQTYVAVHQTGEIVGTYYIKPNQPELGAHVCNCGYIVSEAATGKGVATMMCTHSQHEAKRLGFMAMQFNLVVATNDAAIHLWQKMGFDAIGTLPSAFHHSRYGFVDALVMFKSLEEGH